MKTFVLALVFAAGYLTHQEPARKPLQERELLEVMADYDIRHFEGPVQLPWYGLTDPDAKIIWQVTNPERSTRLKTTIHEACHAILKYRGDSHWDDEEVIQAMTDAEYQRLFVQ